jgi:hypothetical protein
MPWDDNQIISNIELEIVIEPILGLGEQKLTF